MERAYKAEVGHPSPPPAPFAPQVAPAVLPTPRHLGAGHLRPCSLLPWGPALPSDPSRFHVAMTTEDLPTFEELTDLLRIRLGLADALNLEELHSFRELMADHSEVIPDGWYWQAFDELEAQGHP